MYANPETSRCGATLWAFLLPVAVLGTATIAAFWWSGQPEPPPAPAGPLTPPARHATVIVPTVETPVVRTGLTDFHGREVTAACSTCHTTRPANPAARVGTDLATFHQGLHGKHGDLSCVACHDPATGYQTLRLADGKSIPFADVMLLCGQCHGPQYRDYQHGAHGGMTGYWDLTRGGRVRNNCVACHDAHAPRFPTVRPAPGPNDRFLTRPSPEEHGHGR